MTYHNGLSDQRTYELRRIDMIKAFGAFQKQVDAVLKPYE